VIVGREVPPEQGKVSQRQRALGNVLEYDWVLPGCSGGLDAMVCRNDS
jgi:hypothetical protein